MALFGNVPQGYWQGNEFIMPQVDMPQYDLPQVPQAPQVPTVPTAPPSLIGGGAGERGGGGAGNLDVHGNPFTATNAANYIGADGEPYSGGAYSVPYSSQEAGRDISGLLNQPRQTSTYGVTETPWWANMLAGIFPGGTAAMAGLRGLNLSNIQDVQGSLGVPEDEQSSMWNVLNPFSDVAAGDPRAKIADIETGGRDYGVSFGGLLKDAYDKGGVKADFSTGLTPQEALSRLAYAKNMPTPKKTLIQPRRPVTPTPTRQAPDRAGRSAAADRATREAARERNERAGTGNRQGGYSGRAGR